MNQSSQHYPYTAEDEVDEIPNEFTDDEFEDGGSHSENFAPRGSVSSQGSRQNRFSVRHSKIDADHTMLRPKGSGGEFKDQEFQSAEGESIIPDGESSVVEEIVEHKIIELDEDHQVEDKDQIQ
jgi:hypothetical protein